MEKKEKKQDENVVLENKQESKITFWKVVLIIFLVLLILWGVFWVLCWWTVIWIVSLIGFWESKNNNLAFLLPVIIWILALYISYLIIKYWIRLIKYIKNK